MCLWKFPTNCDKGVGAVGARKPKVHQGDVGPMTTKFSDSFHGIRRLGHEKHVLLRADDCSQSLAEDGMILYAQNTNRLGLNHKNVSFGNYSVLFVVLCRTRDVRSGFESFVDPIVDVVYIKTSSSSGR